MQAPPPLPVTSMAASAFQRRASAHLPQRPGAGTMSLASLRRIESMSSEPRARPAGCPGPLDQTDSTPTGERHCSAAAWKAVGGKCGPVTSARYRFAGDNARLYTELCAEKWIVAALLQNNPERAPQSNSRQREFSRRKGKWRITMTGLKTLVAAALISTISTCALAQAAISEPGAFQAQFPNRDVLNGGALTPAGRMGLELPGGASTANNAHAAMGGASPSFRAQRYHSYEPATDTLLGYDGRRHSR
jgi:hypothetical protein